MKFDEDTPVLILNGQRIPLTKVEVKSVLEQSYSDGIMHLTQRVCRVTCQTTNNLDVLRWFEDDSIQIIERGKKSRYSIDT